MTFLGMMAGQIGTAFAVRIQRASLRRAVKPNSHLVLMSPADFARTRRGEKASGAWGFYLRPYTGWTCLLVCGSGNASGTRFLISRTS
jgi:hypothetical protein